MYNICVCVCIYIYIYIYIYKASVPQRAGARGPERVRAPADLHGAFYVLSGQTKQTRGIHDDRPRV